MLGNTAMQAIDQYRSTLDQLSKGIWAHPEAGYRETYACDATAKVLRDAGFEVEIGAGGVPTAIRASFGSGHPVIGLLGEYDALPGLSQECCGTEKKPVEGQGYGHGCGHNLLGVAHVGAAIGIKEEIEKNHLPGTVVYYGCPGEELLTGKPFMARGGAFRDLDLAMAFHPNTNNSATMGVSTALNSAKFHFKGRTAHAGGDPHNGRSALDAVELMDVGANYLREHVTSDVRIHYTILEGGTAPNIVPDKASVWYYVRALSRDVVVDCYDRLVKIAKGAAMMTETEVEIEFLGGCYNRLNNKVLTEMVDGIMRELPQEPWTQEELDFAKKLNESSASQWKKFLQKHNLPEDTQLHTGVLPIQYENTFASSDVGDVGHIVPTVSFTTACFAIGSPGHSWQFTSCSGSSIGEKGMIYAAKVMAVAGARILENPKIAEVAMAEFKASMGGKEYVCPIPDEVPLP